MPCVALSSKHLLGAVRCAVIVFAAISLSTCEKNVSEKDKPFIGAWSKKIDYSTDKKVLIIFEKEGIFKIHFPERVWTFAGTWELADDVMRLVDQYCGTKIPGTYRLLIKGKEINFETLDDKYCGRTDFMPGDWVRENLKKFPSLEHATTPSLGSNNFLQAPAPTPQVPQIQPPQPPQ